MRACWCGEPLSHYGKQCPKLPPREGDRVILAEATTRARDVLGTVLRLDPRLELAEVEFEDGVVAWPHFNDLRVLYPRTGGR